MYVSGDNMLTALSVARDCDMIEKHDKVILVTALQSVDDNKQPQLQWTYTADVKDGAKDKFSNSSPLPSGQVNSSQCISSQMNITLYCSLSYSADCLLSQSSFASFVFTLPFPRTDSSVKM